MDAFELPRLGVNIDHLATLRQLRGTPYPDLLEACRLAQAGGASQITVHLREDRRHIQDLDVKWLRKELEMTLNLEMGATDEMVRIAGKLRPDWSCLVPEKRQEVTTEGGLDLRKGKKRVSQAVARLKKAGVRVSLFIEPSEEAVRSAHELAADAVELHTGRYCLAAQGGAWHKGGPRPELPLDGPKVAPKLKRELARIEKAGALARKLGLHCHAGHGFDFVNVRPVAALRAHDGSLLVEEYNIGHALVCRAALVGMERAVREMISAIHAP